MRTYQVWLEGHNDKCIELQADDVDLEMEGDKAFWNFRATASDDGDKVTVGAFPFDVVAYLVSVS
jgi:hypothetical protein